MQILPSLHLTRFFPACWLLLLLFLALPACSPLGRGQHPPDLHLLEVRPDLSPPAPAAVTGPVLVVSAPWAAPGYDTAAMAYLRKAGQLEYFAFHRWADAPARMLQPLLVAALDRSGAFRAVVQAPTPVRGDLIMESELLRLRRSLPARQFHGNFPAHSARCRQHGARHQGL
jgi:cholesterol transport system auxiliary component